MTNELTVPLAAPTSQQERIIFLDSLRGIAILSVVLCGSSLMNHSNYLESYMASLFSFWSTRMVMAKFDLLEKTTN
ncbi:MAG TPA: hypothetical protein VIS75_15075 [Chitinophagaceae bacterium]